MSRATQDTATAHHASAKRLSRAVAALSRGVRLAMDCPITQSYNPETAGTASVWANPRSLATTGGIIVIFFSYGY